MANEATFVAIKNIPLYQTTPSKKYPPIIYSHKLK